MSLPDRCSDHRRPGDMPYPELLWRATLLPDQRALMLCQHDEGAHYLEVRGLSLRIVHDLTAALLSLPATLAH